MHSQPPQTGKSLLDSNLHLCFTVGRNPRRKVAVATYNDERACDLGRDVLRILTDPERKHQQIFPACEVDRDAASTTRIALTAGGALYFVSRNGALTGRALDLLVIDDLLKDAREAASAPVRKECIDWYTRVGLSRLGPNGAIILAGTRWGRGDLFDYLEHERQEKHWFIVNFPAIAEENDPLGRAPGEPLWPERYDLDFLKQRRMETGPSGWKCLYQGQPRAAEDSILKLEWFQRYTAAPEMRRTIVVTDTAFKTGQQNDYSAIQVWGESKANPAYYLLSAWKGRVEFPELQSKLENFFALWKPDSVVIEDAASGQSLLQVLEASEKPMPLKRYRPDRDKIARASAVSGYLEAGKVFIPVTAPWLADFEDEVQSFPLGLHDDQVDSMTMAIGFLIGKATLRGWIWDAGSKFAELRKQNPATDPLELLRQHPELNPNMAPGALPMSLAEAQMAAQASRLGEVVFRKDRGSFGALKSLNTTPNRVHDPQRGQDLSECPKCGNKNLARYLDLMKCSCGWDSRTLEAAPAQISIPVERNRRPFDFMLERLGF